jgi:peptide deformylase
MRIPFAAEYLVPHPDKTPESLDMGAVEGLKLRYFPDEILRKVCDPVAEYNEEIKQLAKNMILTMMLEKGIGLAAPQVGHLLRIFVVDIRWVNNVYEADPHVFINPEIELVGEDMIVRPEGCLSFPSGSAKIKRHVSVRVKHLNLEGVETITEADGLFARVIQHEADHLDGKTIQKDLSSFDLGNVRVRIKEKLRKGNNEAKPRHHQHSGHKHH